MDTAKDMIEKILSRGGDPTKFRKNMAQMYRLTVEEVDVLIAAAGPTRDVDPEAAAQDRLAEERREARANRAAWRAHNHEEE
jgi:hypothetical protein